MNEFENDIQSDTIDVDAVSDKKFVHIDKSKRIFDIVYLALCSAFMLVMWCTGYNFLPLIANVLAIVAGVLIFARVLAKSNVGLYMWIAYMVCICGLFVFFLIWGAESFGKNLWYNLVLVLFPVLLATLVYVSDKFITKKTALKITCAVCSFLMVGTAIVYVFFMNLRCRPTVESLQAGHDDYLASVKNKYTTQDKPNVLVILMDDMAYSDISAYSYLSSKINGTSGTVTDSKNATINTPNIDSIADGGIMMDNFYSASPVCSPSRFSILTGRYSSRGYLDNVVFPSDIQSNPWSPTHFLNPYQFLNNVDGILGDEITFAEVLQAAGYNTGCIGKWNLGDYGQYLPTSQGFDYFYGSYYVNDMTPYTGLRTTLTSKATSTLKKCVLTKKTSTNPKARDCSPQKCSNLSLLQLKTTRNSLLITQRRGRTSPSIRTTPAREKATRATTPTCNASRSLTNISAIFSTISNPRRIRAAAARFTTTPSSCSPRTTVPAERA